MEQFAHGLAQTNPNISGHDFVSVVNAALPWIRTDLYAFETCMSAHPEIADQPCQRPATVAEFGQRLLQVKPNISGREFKQTVDTGLPWIQVDLEAYQMCVN